MTKVIMMGNERRRETGVGNAPSAYRAARQAGVMAIRGVDLSTEYRLQKRDEEPSMLLSQEPGTEVIIGATSINELISDTVYDDSQAHAIGKKALDLVEVEFTDLVTV